MPGLLYAEILSGHNIIVYLTVLLIPFSAWVLYKTRFGLRLRAVGENPLAVDTAGISVIALRYQAVIISGVLCGVAGTYLSIAASSGFVRDMTVGKGYLALAALIFGKWKCVPDHDGLLALRLHGRSCDPTPGSRSTRDRGYSRSVHHCLALYSHGSPPCRLRRKRRRSEGDRRSLTRKKSNARSFVT